MKIKFALFDQFGHVPAYEMVLMKTAVVKELPKLFELPPIYHTHQISLHHSSCTQHLDFLLLLQSSNLAPISNDSKEGSY